MATKNMIGGLVIGSVLGIITGILIAPSSGKQMRKKLQRKSRKYSNDAIQAVRLYLEGKGKSSSYNKQEVR